jgi:hypothetical protein
MIGPLSLSGHPLKGDRIVRLVYLDEAGISNIKEEPFLVVAGVIIHSDNQWKMVENRLSEIVIEYIPENMRDGFIFQAKELFNGGKFFDRAVWPRVKRWEILVKLLKIMPDLGLPVAFAQLNRAESSAQYRFTGVDIEVIQYISAFFTCVIQVEEWMRKNAPSEVAMLIAEDRHKVKTLVKRAQAALHQKDKISEELLNLTTYLPLTHIIDTVHFAGKAESSPLQLADVCAVTLKRKAMNKPDGELGAWLVPCLRWHIERGGPVLGNSSSAATARNGAT